MSETVCGARTRPIGSAQALQAKTYTVCVSGSYEPPGQFVPPEAVPTVKVPSGPSSLLSEGGVNTGPSLYFEAIAFALSLISGVKSTRSPSSTPLRLYAGGFEGIGCVFAYHSPGTVPTSTGCAGIGHAGLPVTRSKTYRKPCLLGWATALTGFPSTVMSARIGAEEMSISQSA